MFLFICVFMASMDMNFSAVLSTFNGEKILQNCTDFKNLYLIEGQVVEWSNSIQGHAWVNGCVNQTVVENDLDNSMVVKYAYNELYLSNTIWIEVPEEAATEMVSMSGVTPIGVWGGCSQMRKIEITSPVNFTLISPDWLVNCTQLQEIVLSGFSVAEISHVLDTISTVQWLKITGVPDIEKVLWDPIFPLARGGHRYINGLDLFVSNSPNSLGVYNTSWDEVSESFIFQLSLLPRLEIIRIYNFHELDWCASANYSSVTFPSLKQIWMPGTSTSAACFRTLRLAPNLMNLAISFDKVQFSELSASCAPQLRVEFADVILFDRNDYLKISNCKEHKKSNVTFINVNNILCDCGDSLWLTRAILEGFVTLPFATCTDGSPLEDQSCDWLYCKRVTCNTSCVCCDDSNNGLVADCRDANLDTIPKEVTQLTNLTELLIPRSNLTALPDEFPDSLIFIDLFGNDLLRRPDPTNISTLFSVPERIVRLASNPIVCSCEHQLVIKELQLFNKQIEDYQDITCAGENKMLSEVNVQALCAERDHSAFVLYIVTAALVIAVICLVLGAAFYYRRQIKIFLFARGWCLWCINEEELDADRRYDVFLSFCHSDEAFVTEELLSKLDKEYAVCVHFRNWNPGGMIPAQIWSSVEQSRRTIIVLSCSFVKSLWGLLEFRSAYVSGLSEGRIRVVMVVIDDVLEKEDLQGELRAYIRLNTYVKWGDPWFWDKLRFALPHRPAAYEPERQCNPGDNYAYNVYYQSGIVQMLAINAPEIDNGPLVDENVTENSEGACEYLNVSGSDENIIDAPECRNGSELVENVIENTVTTSREVVADDTNEVIENSDNERREASLNSKPKTSSNSNTS